MQSCELPLRHGPEAGGLMEVDYTAVRSVADIRERIGHNPGFIRAEEVAFVRSEFVRPKRFDIKREGYSVDFSLYFDVDGQEHSQVWRYDIRTHEYTCLDMNRTRGQINFSSFFDDVASFLEDETGAKKLAMLDGRSRNAFLKEFANALSSSKIISPQRAAWDVLGELKFVTMVYEPEEEDYYEIPVKESLNRIEIDHDEGSHMRSMKLFCETEDGEKKVRIISYDPLKNEYRLFRGGRAKVILSVEFLEYLEDLNLSSEQRQLIEDNFILDEGQQQELGGVIEGLMEARLNEIRHSSTGERENVIPITRGRKIQAEESMVNRLTRRGKTLATVVRRTVAAAVFYLSSSHQVTNVVGTVQPPAMVRLNDFQVNSEEPPSLSDK